MYLWNVKKYALSLLVLLCHVTILAQRSSLDLSGRWEFAVDPEGKLTASSQFDDHIELPASMPQRLKGNRPTVRTRWTGSLYDSSYFFNPYMAKYRTDEDLKLPFFLTPARHYVGDAWYRTRVTVPKSFQGQRIVLFLERPHIVSTLYINTREVGTCNSLSVPHEFDVTDYVKPGETVTLCLRVNNNPDKVGVGADSHSVTDQTQGNWNGIVGRMELRSMPRTHIAHVDVFPNAKTLEVSARVTLVRGSKKTETVSLALIPRQKAAEGGSSTSGVYSIMKDIVLDKDTVCVEVKPISCKVKGTKDVSFGLWDEFNPVLSTFTTELMDKKMQKKLDTNEQTFGFRNVETRGKDILINGRPTMLRGTVENCCFPLTGYPPTDKESWLKVFRKCKEYGLNHIRFHSYCPPEAAFEAADEVGMYLQPEGPSWPNHGIKLGNGMMIDKYLMEETERMVEAYGNHPSFTMLSSGNEPAGNWVKWVSMFVDTWRARDSRRIYTGASVGGGWAWQPKNQYHVKAGARGLDWNKRQPNTMDDFCGKIDTVSQPFVSHETGQWCVFPDLTETRLYTGVNKARNFEIFADILRDKGMESMARKFLMASGKLQVLCYKYELEKTLRTPHYAGYQLLGLNDYSGQGTALVGPLNVFWQEKGYVDAKLWREFGSPVTVLASLPRFTYYSGEEIPFELKVVNYGEGAIENYELQAVFLNDKGEVVKTFTLPMTSDKIHVGGDVLKLASWKAAFNFAAPAHLTLRATLKGTVKGQHLLTTNHWDVWIYPHHEAEKVGTKEAKQRAKELTISHSATSTDVRKAIERGGKVLILAADSMTYGRDIVQQFTPVFWNTSWFKMRPPHTTGMYIDKAHPLFKNFPTEDFSNLQWWSLMNAQPVMLMDNMPKDFMPIVQPIDTWFLSRKLGMLFEANVGKAKVLVTTMPLEHKGDPAVEQMLHAVLQYMKSEDFRPSHSLGVDRLAELFSLPTPPVNMFTNDSPDELKKGIR